MRQLTKAVLGAGALLLSSAVSAIPLPYTGTIVNDSWRLTEYSVVRDGVDFDSPVEHRFDSHQTIDYFVDVVDGEVVGVSASSQQFTLDGGTALFDLISLDIAPGGSGRPEGTLDYSITSGGVATSGTFLFYDDMWGGPFNSMNYNFRAGDFYLYLFGGDKDAGISLDIAITRVVEPTGLALLGIGALCLAAARRRVA